MIVHTADLCCCLLCGPERADSRQQFVYAHIFGLLTSFHGVFFRSRVSGASPVTTDLIITVCELMLKQNLSLFSANTCTFVLLSISLIIG